MERTSTTRRRALRALVAPGFAGLAATTAAADDDAPGNSGDHRQDDGRGDNGRGNGDRGNGDRGNGDDSDGENDESTGPSVSVTRRDDGRAFTGGQTNRVDLDVAASEPVLVRDRVPSDWTVVGGDDRTTYTVDGERYVEFRTAVVDGTRTYLAEAPTDPAATGVHEFGPVAYSVDGETWSEVDATSRTVVIGQST